MGWDELVDSEIPEGATIFGWRGMGNAAEEAGCNDFISKPIAQEKLKEKIKKWLK
jgi:FixJ family two-component response regulator